MHQTHLFFFFFFSNCRQVYLILYNFTALNCTCWLFGLSSSSSRFPSFHCVSPAFLSVCACIKKAFSSGLYSSVCVQILYYSLRLMANLFPNCLDRQGKVRAPFGQSISQRPVSTSFSRWSTLNICFYERRACNLKAPVPVAESWHCLENVNVPLKVLKAI